MKYKIGYFNILINKEQHWGVNYKNLYVDFPFFNISKYDIIDFTQNNSIKLQIPDIFRSFLDNFVLIDFLLLLTLAVLQSGYQFAF